MSGMISDAEMMNLSDDPEQAFVECERHARGRLEEAVAKLTDNETGNACHLAYMSTVLGVAAELDIGILTSWKLPPPQDEIWNIAQSFINDVDHCTVRIRMRLARRKKRYSVAFDSATKEKLRHHLNQMLEVVQNLEVSSRKRDALYSKINTLMAEINSDWTRFESLADLTLEVADTVGQAATKMEPLRPFIESITGYFAKSKRAQDDQAQLPRPQEQKRIEPPRDKAPKSKGGPFSVELDDEIPF